MDAKDNPPEAPLAYGGVAEAARAIQVSRAMLYKAVQRGDIECRKFGRCTLIEREELIRFLRSLPKAGRN